MAIPAAQYLRMSTEDQQYSMTNQSLRIKEYADKHGFDIVKTYEDPGKSGVIIKHRHGLRALLCLRPKRQLSIEGSALTELSLGCHS
jgi:predicted site-specific integrase-resolvase